MMTDIQRMRCAAVAHLDNIEVLIHTGELGICGKGSEFYGFGFKGAVVNIKGTVWTVRMTAQGFYGGWDSPDTPVRGQPVIVLVDWSMAKNADGPINPVPEDPIVRLQF